MNNYVGFLNFLMNMKQTLCADSLINTNNFGDFNSVKVNKIISNRPLPTLYENHIKIK